MTDLDDDDLFAVRSAPAAQAAAPPPPAPPAPRKPKPIAWRANEGVKPTIRKGKLVAVELRNGEKHGEEPVNKDSALGWDPETTRWSFTAREGDPCRAFDVIRFRVH